MSRVVRTRTAALLSIVLFAVMAIVAAQLVTSGAGTSQPPVRAQRMAHQARDTALQGGRRRHGRDHQTARHPRPSSPTDPRAGGHHHDDHRSAGASTNARPGTGTDRHPATAPPSPRPSPAPSDPSVVPPVGQATAWGCGAALAYLQAYAAKSFTLECPGYAEGQEAMTCMNQAGVCPGTSVIAIADPCPQAYMNEASNSYVILGLADTPIDPFGPCP